MTSLGLRTSFRGIPPRLLIRYRDNQTTRFPTVARNVSSTDRSGNFSIGPFNDTRTIVFKPLDATSGNNAVIFPIKLTREDATRFGLYNSSLLTPGQNSMGTSFPEMTGSVLQGVSDVFINDPVITKRYTVTTQSYVPYKEVNQFAQTNTSSFYMTGTDYSTVGPGFTSQLGSKTQIKLVFPHTQKYVFLSQTASIAYYNLTSQSFVQVGDVTNPSDAFANTLGAVESIIPNRWPGTQAMNYGYDCRLFGPWGSPLVTGTVGRVTVDSVQSAEGFNAPSTKLGYTFGVSGSTPIADIFGPTEFLSASVTKNATFAAPSGAIIRLNEVQHPFVIEKAVLEFPLSASSNWLNDITTHVYVSESGRDIGGPCITFALLRESSRTHREIILSATVIPIGDAISQSYVSEQTTLTFAIIPETVAQGFRSFSKPSAIVSGTNGSFQGIIRAEAVAAITNGCISSRARAGTSPRPFNDSRIRAYTAFGRAMDRTPSGRSIFGKEFSFPNANDFLPALPTDTSITNDLFVFEQHSFSPYVIMPGDKLIFSVSKHRSVVTNPEMLPDGNRTLLTASHDVAIDVGEIKITLFGSSIRNGEEIQQCRNEPFVSNNVTEVIGSVDVFDQFDVAPRITFSGSYVDDFISGTIGSEVVNVRDTRLDGRRGVKISAIKDGPNLLPAAQGGVEQIGFGSTALKRNVNFFAGNEIYYDSLVPSPDEIQTIDGGDRLIFTTTAPDGATWTVNDTTIIFPLRSNASLDQSITLIGGLQSTITENTDWPLGYPFETRYGSITRKLKPTLKNNSNKEFAFYGYTAIITDNVVKVAKGQSIIRANSAHRPYGVGAAQTASLDILQNSEIVSATSASFNSRWEKDQFEKGFYGFGDFNDNQPIWKQFSTTGSTSSDNATNFYRSALIRGWKYGLYSGIPKTTKLQFRRTHFGNFRDMLEQRPFTKFINAVNERKTNSPVNVRFTSASHSTQSSNFSFEATSSLPYFDGIARN